MLFLLWSDAWIDVAAAEAATRGRCRLSSDRAALASSDAVVFPVPTLADLPSRRGREDQLWVLWCQESGAHYPLLDDPVFVASFDLTATYRLDSDVPLPYSRPRDYADLPPMVPLGERRATPATAWISSRFDRCGRTAYLRELMEHLEVDSYGQALNNASLPVDRGPATKLATIARYRFTIAFENAIDDDYVTEKLAEPLVAGSVPVVRGARNVAAFAPGGPGSFVDAADFTGPRDLARYLTAMGDEDYLRLHDWRTETGDGEWWRRNRVFDEPTFDRLARAVRAVRIGRAARERRG